MCRYVQSWIDGREVQSEKANLTILFDKYIPVLLDASRSTRFKKITPIQEVRSGNYFLAIKNCGVGLWSMLLCSA